MRERGFTALRVQVERDEWDVSKMKVERYKNFGLPLLLFFDSEGNVARKVEGKIGKAEFLEIIRDVK